MCLDAYVCVCVHVCHHGSTGKVGPLGSLGDSEDVVQMQLGGWAADCKSTLTRELFCSYSVYGKSCACGIFFYVEKNYMSQSAFFFSFLLLTFKKKPVRVTVLADALPTVWSSTHFLSLCSQFFHEWYPTPWLLFCLNELIMLHCQNGIQHTENI